MEKGLEKCFQTVYEFIRIFMLAGFIWFLYDLSKIFAFILGIVSIISYILKLKHVTKSFYSYKSKCQKIRKEIDEMVDISLDEENNAYKKDIHKSRFELGKYKKKEAKGLI